MNTAFGFADVDFSQLFEIFGFNQLEQIVLGLFLLYFLLGASQLLRIPGVMAHIRKQNFPDKDRLVSLMVPIHTVTPTLERSLETFCNQDHRNYELLVLIQEPGSPSHELAEKVAEKYEHMRVIPVTEPHDPKKCVAKAHNLLQGVKLAKGEVFVFSDSDVPHSKDWLRKLSNPIGEDLRGKTISGTTSVFLMAADGFVGNFSALTVNQATILSSFIGKDQDFPAFASGASMAVLAETFHELGMEEIWGSSFNDDLVLANTLVKNHKTVFNVRSQVTRPVEDFKDFSALFTKLRRWILTVRKYFHKDTQMLVMKLLASNFQFPLAVDVIVLLWFMGLLGHVEVSAAFMLTLFTLAYLYTVFFRAALAWFFKEKNLMKYMFLTPISFIIWGTPFLFLSFFTSKFTWGGIEYDIKGDLNRES